MVTVNLTPASVISASVSESTISVSLTTTPISVTVSDGITIAAGDTRYLRRANNLSDLANAGTARTNLGVVIGTDVQAWDAQLDDIAALAVADGNFIVGDGTNWVAESGSVVRTSLGLVAGGAGDIWVEKAGDTMTGQLGIGIAPEHKLHVAGTISEIGSDQVLSKTRLAVAPTGITARRYKSLEVQLTYGNTTYNSTTRLLSALHGVFVNNSTATITYASCTSVQIQTIRAGGTIINAYGFRIESASATAGIITNLYGLNIANQTAGDTLNYAIYTNAGLIRFGDHTQIHDNKELRFYDDGNNHVGFEAPALSADQIWVLPDADGKAGDVFTTNGSGTLSWLSGASEKSWAFRSRSGAFGTAYAGGFYEHSSSANDFSTGPTFGTANAARAAHFFIVTGADTVDELTIRITGTSILDTGGSRTTGATADIVIPNATAAGAYYETTEKWPGAVTITIISGTAKICDFGFVKYWDNNNTDFALVGLEATWLGGATDTDPNLILRHHKGTDGNTDFTYTGSGATPPTAIAAMATDHVTENNVVNGENGAWKRTDLSVSINGSGKEGTIFEIVTTANKAFELGNLLLRIIPQ